MQKISIIILAIVIITSIVLVSLWLYKPNLHRLHVKIENEFSSVRHISPDEYSQLNLGDTVIFDIREHDEYSVSHIRQAIHITPSMSANNFLQAYGHILKDKKAVFYCSVGYRSSAYIEKINQLHNAHDMVNLKGGLFMWANQGRDIQGSGVHPYNDFWGRLIKDKSLIRYIP